MGTVFWGLLGGIWNEKWIHPRSFHHGFCIQCSLFKNGPFKGCNTLKAMVTWGSPISKNTLLQKPLVTRWLGNLSLNKTASTWLFTSLTYSSTNSAVERGHSFLVFIIVRCMSLYIYIYISYTLYTSIHTIHTYVLCVSMCHNHHSNITVNPVVSSRSCCRSTARCCSKRNNLRKLKEFNGCLMVV